MAIHFGPAGLGPVKTAVATLEDYHKLGLTACEIAFTHSIYIKRKEDAVAIGEKARELGIYLSIHAPYYINLNSTDKLKIENSKRTLLECCKVGTWLGAVRVVFHAGFYGKMARQECYQNIKEQIIDLQVQLKKQGYTTKLAPEIMGKVNVFGSIEEIAKLSEETGCDCCIDFAHILARYKDYKLRETLATFKNAKELHIHFSGIDYGEKGEKNHKKTPEKDLKLLIESLPKSKKITLINESPYLVEDAVLGLNIYHR